MFNYKSKTGVVNYKRFAINSTTGVTLANKHPELDKLVDSGDLVLEATEATEAPVVEIVPPTAPTAAAAPVAPVASVKNETPVKPTA